MHVAGKSARDCTDIERNRKTRPPPSCHQNSGANLDTFAKEQSLVSKLTIIRQSKCDWSITWSRPCLGLREGSWFFKIVWKWRLPHAMRRACLNGNIIINPVITVAKVFVTTIISTFRRNSHQNWQSGTRTASERWEIDLVKEVRRDVKVGDSLSNLRCVCDLVYLIYLRKCIPKLDARLRMNQTPMKILINNICAYNYLHSSMHICMSEHDIHVYIK